MDRRWLLGGVLLAGGFGFVRAVSYRPKLTPESRILLLGDSMAQGMLPHFRKLSEEEGLSYVGAGLPGTRIDQWVDSNWLTKKLSEFAPTHALVVLGTNDAYAAQGHSYVRERTKELVEKIEAAGAHPIWIGAPKLPENYFSNRLDEDVLDHIRSATRYYFASEDYDIPRGPDELHPSAGGYAGWAGAIWNWLT